MGNFIKKNKTTSKRVTSVGSGKKVLHKAKVLTPADVEANRSSAYRYLAL